jgi:hypothetical protein
MYSLVKMYSDSTVYHCSEEDGYVVVLDGNPDLLTTDGYTGILGVFVQKGDKIYNRVRPDNVIEDILVGELVNKEVLVQVVDRKYYKVNGDIYCQEPRYDVHTKMPYKETMALIHTIKRLQEEVDELIECLTKERVQ